VLTDRPELVILDYERASNVIENASVITVGRCYCRHKQEHLGVSCKNPQDVCLTFNDTADSLSRHGIAERITKEKARQILARSIDLGLVQIGDNVQQKVNWICNCCSCCCEAIQAYTRLGAAPKINSNFAPHIHKDDCTGCGACIERCPVGAISLERPAKKGDRAHIDQSVCIGCGVCVRFCASGALVMERREETTFVPVDSFERVLLSAIDTGKLGNFISDNFDLLSPTLMRRMVGFILRMGPIKRRLVDRQISSRYLTAMTRLYYRINPDQLDGTPPDYSHPEIYRR
jgi:ferredoxin